MANVSTEMQKPADATFPSIPEPTLDVQALLATVKRLKEAVEMLTGQRGGEGQTWSVPDNIRRIQELQAKVVTSIEETQAGEASAKIFVSAEADKTGYRAVYGWRLTAGNVKAGMYTLVKNDGTAEMGFGAAQFKLMDPGYNTGLPVQVFNYANGVFTFGVPVRIFGSQIPGYSLGSDGSLHGSYITNATLTGGKIVNGSIVNNHIGEALFDAKIAGIDGNKIWDLTVGSAKIAALAVDSTKIANAAIVNAKIGDLQVTNGKIGNLEVNNIKITAGAVTNTAGASSNGSYVQASIYCRAGAWILITWTPITVNMTQRGGTSDVIPLYFSNTGAQIDSAVYQTFISQIGQDSNGVTYVVSSGMPPGTMQTRMQAGSEGTYTFHFYASAGVMVLTELAK